jgi:hypothetical protein
VADDIGNEDPRAELERLEGQISELRRTVSDLRAGLNDAGPSDPEDRSLVISQAQEQEAIMVQLERRRDRLREQLGTA